MKEIITQFSEESFREIIKQAVRECLSDSNHPPDELLTVKQVANLLDLTAPTIYKMVHNGTIPFHRCKGTRRLYFSRDEIIDWLKLGKWIEK